MNTLARRWYSIGVCSTLLFLLGCGSGFYPTRGKVTLEDGSPLTQGMVVFENAEGTSMARGMIQSDGTFELSTGTPGDGVKPGHYRVLVSALDMTDIPDEQKKLPFDIKYTRFQTSGLEFDVKSEPNHFPIQLTRPSKGAGKAK
jgi:hypothetical protein